MDGSSWIVEPVGLDAGGPITAAVSGRHLLIDDDGTLTRLTFP